MNHQIPQSKYAIAQINIPIEIFPDGEWTNHNDRITIQIAETPELPPISNIENQQLLETIQKILGGSQDTDNEPPTRISLSLDDDTPPPFTIQIREPESTETQVSIQEEEGKYGEEEEAEQEDPPQPKTYYIDPKELLLRKHRKPSKNNTFKLSPHPRANKTRSNRWVLNLSSHPH